MHGDIDLGHATAPKLFVGQIDCTGLIGLFWPELVAFGPSLLVNVTCGDDQSHVLLGDHAPKVGEGVVEGSLARYYLPIVDVAQRPVHEVSIDVRRVLWVLMLKRGSGDEVYSGMLEWQDVRVTIFGL